MTISALFDKEKEVLMFQSKNKFNLRTIGPQKLYVIS